jgi:hypothetical protein
MHHFAVLRVHALDSNTTGGNTGPMASGDQQQMAITAMQKLSTDYQSNAEKCGEIANFLKNPLTTMFWQSQAASTFRQDMDGYIKMLGDFQNGFQGLSKEIDRRVLQLQTSKNV